MGYHHQQLTQDHHLSVSVKFLTRERAYQSFALSRAHKFLARPAPACEFVHLFQTYKVHGSRPYKRRSCQLRKSSEQPRQIQVD